MTEARSESFFLITWVVNPGVPFGTRKPRMPSSICAHTTATSATEPLIIHIFCPLRIQFDPSRRALVRIEPGSVRPKQPLASPAAMLGSHSCHCSSEPQRWMANMANEPCTETRLRIALSPASSSMQATP